MSSIVLHTKWAAALLDMSARSPVLLIKPEPSSEWGAPKAKLAKRRVGGSEQVPVASWFAREMADAVKDDIAGFYRSCPTSTATATRNLAECPSSRSSRR